MSLPLPASEPRPSGYDFSCPDGEWIGRLDAKQWGRNLNLTLYFTDEGGGERYWFSVFHREAYRPRDGQVDFKEVEPGARFRLNTRISDKGTPVFLGATRLD